jgi:hypothetical protein
MRLHPLPKSAAVLAASVLITSCSSAGKEAEEQYELVETTGSHREKCDAIRRVTSASLQEQNQERYSYWKLQQDMECLDAELPEQDGAGATAL